MAHLAICRSQGQSCREGYRQTVRIRRAHDARTDQAQLTGGMRVLSTNALTLAPPRRLRIQAIGVPDVLGH